MNLGFSEMLFIFLIALLIFGPKKMPEIGRQIGKALAEFKRASNDFKAQLETEIRHMEIEEALRKEKESLTQAIMPPINAIASGSLLDSVLSGPPSDVADAAPPVAQISDGQTDSLESPPTVQEAISNADRPFPDTSAGNGGPGNTPPAPGPELPQDLKLSAASAPANSDLSKESDA